MRKISLDFVATEDSITVYWERTKEMAAGDPFRVFLDGGEAACTEKTHYTLAGLLPEHGYRVRVSSACQKDFLPDAGRAHICGDCKAVQ